MEAREALAHALIAEAVTEPFFWKRLTPAYRGKIVGLIQAGDVNRVMGSSWRSNNRLYQAQYGAGDRKGALETLRYIARFGKSIVENNGSPLNVSQLLNAEFWLEKLGDKNAADEARSCALKAMAKASAEERASTLAEKGFSHLAALALMQNPPQPLNEGDTSFYWIGYRAATVEKLKTAPLWVATLKDPRDQIDALSGFLVGRAIPQSSTIRAAEDEWSKQAWGNSVFVIRSEFVEREEWGK